MVFICTSNLHKQAQVGKLRRLLQQIHRLTHKASAWPPCAAGVNSNQRAQPGPGVQTHRPNTVFAHTIHLYHRHIENTSDEQEPLLTLSQ